ncbi:MAG: substrate-binding domain-containing protein [Burkholderiaceae bacterium]|nr:substrate-binding domain-containing protein [Burkholderiaceae bacterium]
MTDGAPEDLRVLSAGAAQGLVAAVSPRFLADTGVALQTTFGAVGAIREKLLEGEPCDVLILTASMLDELAAGGYIIATTRTALGQVRTGVGVRTSDTLPEINDRAALERCLRSATEIFLPDPQRATAGIHFKRVLEQLGIFADVAPRLRPHPNGATAMRALAQSGGTAPIGCTQISEIKYADGVTLVGPLPKEFELATVYSVAVWADARQSEVAQRFAELLSGPETGHLRAEAGFEV